MNERIKELWEEAAKEHYGDTWEQQTAFMDKFAELIVRKCVDQINQMHRHARTTNLRNYENACIADAVRIIKEHFGVE